jgi:FkbM family methyltransferase
MRLTQSLSSKLEYFWSQARDVGTLGALKLKLIYKYNQIAAHLHLSPFWPTVRLRLPAYDIRVYLRPGTSDLAVLNQIFAQREYAPLDKLGTIRTIIDCGANVGYSSLYFLNQYPLAQVIAVEPDPANAAICRKNLAQYGNRAQLIQSAVWSHPTRLALARGVYGDGREWATQVREINPNEATHDLLAIDMPTLLSLCGNGRADILKVDIERSETVVFQDASQWLHLIGNIAIELHDVECENIFFTSLRRFRCDITRSGELTICRNLELESAS